MYEVIKYFTDAQDDGHPYNVGDAYPRKGLTVSEERIKELSTTSNKRGIVLIKEVKAKEGKADKTEKVETAEPKPKTSKGKK